MGVLLLLRDLLGFCRIHNPAMRSHASVHGLLFVCLSVCFCLCFSLGAVRLTDDWETSDFCVRYSAHGRGRPCLGVRVLFGKVDGRKSRIDGICYAPVAVWVTSGRKSPTSMGECLRWCQLRVIYCVHRINLQRLVSHVFSNLQTSHHSSRHSILSDIVRRRVTACLQDAWPWLKPK